MLNLSRINFLLFILLGCFWSGSFIGIKEVIQAWPPIFGAAMRVGIALVSIMLLLLIMRKKIDVPYSLRLKIGLIGLFSQAIPFSFLFWGEQLVSPGLAGILNGTTPLWTFIFALIFLPRLTSVALNNVLGLIIGLLGMIIIFWSILSFEKNTSTFLGAGAVMIMAMSYAVGGLLNQYFLKGERIEFFTNVYYQHWASVIFLIISSLIFEKWPGAHYLFSTYRPWLASAYLGICSTAIAYVIYYHLIREWDALRASTVLYFLPVLTLVWDYLFFDNKPGIYEVVGVFGILVGVILIQLPSLFSKWIRLRHHASSFKN